MKKTTHRAKKSASKKARQHSSTNAIDKLILEDHKPLKKLIKLMKNDQAVLTERNSAFEKFVSLLTIHAKAEEQALYTYLQEGDEFREEGFEGQVEHGLADLVAKESQQTVDEDFLGARIKVLAELVEHHIKEEEEDLIPAFRKKTEIETRVSIGQRYLELRTELETTGLDRNAEQEPFVEMEQGEVIIDM